MTFATKNGFRALVVTSYVIALGGFVDIAFPSLLAPELQAYFAKAELTTKGTVAAVLSTLLLIAGLVALYGLLRFRSWARTLYVALTVAGIIMLATVIDEQISSGLAATFLYVSDFLGGVVLAMMYLAPVKDYFGAKEI